MAQHNRETYDGKGNLLSTEIIEYDDAPVLKEAAQKALLKTDIVALRCFKNGVPFPADWKIYVDSLRSIASSGKGAIPSPPPYPEGT